MQYLDLKNYTKLEKIGFGSFGEVYKIQDKKTKQIYAAKISTKILDELPDDFIKNLEREITIISKIHHPAILKFIGLSLTNFENESKPVIVTEYLENGSLDDVLLKSHRGIKSDQWNDTMKLITIYGIASAMDFLHQNNIIHRDLKPANILLNEYLFPILADFGLSKDESIESSTIQIKGSPLYISPEVWNDVDYTNKCDVYAYAYILYEIYANERPFKDLKMYQLAKRITEGKRPDTSFIPSPYKDLIESCWENEPSDRPSFNEIIEQLETNPDFITDAIDKDDFDTYVNYIKNSPKSFDKYVKIDPFDATNTKIIKRVDISKSIYPEDQLAELSKSCQKLVRKADDDTDKQYEVGYNLINAKDGFPENKKLGVKYLKSAIKGGSIEAVIYYNRLLIIGHKIDKNIEKAKQNLDKYNDLQNPNIFLLKAMIEKKAENYPKTIKLLKKSIKAGVGEAMFEYGKMLYLGQGCDENEEKAMHYFKKAKKNGCSKSDKFLEKQKGKAKNNEKSKTKYDKKIDLVILIDGQKTTKFYFDALSNSIKEIASKFQQKYQKIFFRFGVVIYRDLILSQKSLNVAEKRPIVLDLTRNIDEVQSFLNDYLPVGGGLRNANDWASGYNALLEEISWDESSEKVVIQISNSPGYGKTFTMRLDWHKKYLDIPKFRGHRYFQKDFERYVDLQKKQNGWLGHLISDVAENGIKFYCLNGNEVALYCFNEVSSLYNKRGGKKFVIKDLFGYNWKGKDDDDGGSVDVEMLKDKINSFVTKVIDSCAVPNDDDNESKFEIKCNKKFKEDLNAFNMSNKTILKSVSDDDDDDDDHENIKKNNSSNHPKPRQQYNKYRHDGGSNHRKSYKGKPQNARHIISH